MKIDLLGEKNTGFAMGLNEFAGHLAVALVAFSIGIIASEYRLRPYPFYIGIDLSIAGLITSLLLIKDTKHHVAAESANNTVPKLKNVFWDTTFFHRNLGSVAQAGLVNNLSDGLIWGLLPILLAEKTIKMKKYATKTYYRVIYFL
jgi:hypothetical protein